jgi:hypothetical protein
MVSLAILNSAKRGEENETNCASGCSDGCAFGVRDNAAATADADLPGWIVGPGRDGLPDSAASATAATADPLRRTRLIS